MKVFELLKKVDFDTMIPTLDRLTAPSTKLSQTAYYRMAYDEMMMTQPAADADPIEIERGEDGQLNGSSAFHLEGDFWSNSLGREIVLSDGPEISDEVLAAHILWSMTFYGFSQKHRGSSYRSSGSDEFIKKSLDIYARRMAAYGRVSLKKARKLDCLTDEYSKVSDVEMKNRKRRNRAKRMRDHRHDMLIKKYDRMGKVKGTIEGLLARADDFTEEQFSYLYDTKWVSDNCYLSQCSDNSRRIDYILELISKYSDIDYSTFDSLVLMVTIDPEYPLTDTETEKVEKFVEAAGPWKRSECGFSETKGFGEGAEMLIVASQDKGR